MRLNRSLVGLGLAVLCALTMMSLPVPYKQAVASQTHTGLLATGQLLFSRVIRYSRNEQKTRFLLGQNVQLALDNMGLREAAAENARLRQALQFREAQGPIELIAAEVIGRDPDQLFDTIVINAGRDRGIEAGWPVITAAGLVGHLAEVDAESAVVQLLMRSPVSAVVQDGRAQGIVSWVSGNRFRLRFVEASSSIKAGDRVVSSGLGGRYPKGILIGVLTEVHAMARDPLFQDVMLESCVDFLRLEEVFVVRPGAYWP